MRNITIALVLTITASCNSSKKTSENATTELTETYWKLTELMGKPINSPSVTGKEIFITFLKEGNALHGNGGCNTFRGKYELKEGNRISFSPLASTMMACPDLDSETSFMKAVESADNYIITGNSLQLNKARMAPLARFEAVKK